MNSNEFNFLDTFFISNNSLKPFNLDSKIKLWNYYDISNKRFLTFYFENNDLYILLKQNIFGSAFLGNQVFFNPKFIIIKKFDPTLILINFLYSSQEKNKYLNIETLIDNYDSQLQQNDKYEIDIKFKNSILFIKKILEIYEENMNLICEIIKDDINAYKFLESKVIIYLNNKINLNDNEILEIKSNYNEKDFEIYKKRKFEEKCRIICEFLPPEIKENYFNSKQIQYKYVEIIVDNNNNNNNNININKKRKNNNGENIKKTGKKNEKNIPNDQRKLENFGFIKE